MSLAFVFPGQGSQSVGMLDKLADTEKIVRQTLEEASTALGYDLWRLIHDGPAEALNETEKTQPAILTASVAAWRVWRERGGPAPTVMAGHSLGEYSALVCADSVGFAEAVDLVRYRGQAMQQAVPVGVGAMAAILGLEDEAVNDACAQAAKGQVLEAVNFNAPGQVVIAGHAEAVERGVQLAKELGAKRATPLPVSAPFHSSLMMPAAEAMRERLRDVCVRTTLVPEVYTVDAKTHTKPDAIRTALVAQLHEPVRWADTVRAMLAGGVDQIVECGPGRVLSGLNKRIERSKELSHHTTGDLESIEAAIASCWEKLNA